MDHLSVSGSDFAPPSHTFLLNSIPLPTSALPSDPWIRRTLVLWPRVVPDADLLCSTAAELWRPALTPVTHSPMLFGYTGWPEETNLIVLGQKRIHT